MRNMQVYQFPISVYGQLEKYNDTISKCRCRIFYKYANRNGTYITDEFADQFLETIAYTPIKGIFTDGDYSDHGQKCTEGRIYGIVPESYNLQWEPHLDSDGVLRTYACVDVLLFTALYEEAKSIPFKAQSMEIYGESIRGDWANIDGQDYFVFETGKSLALQVLGNKVEPCFEGAAFYTLKNSIESIFEEVERISKEINKGGNNLMKQVVYNVSEDSVEYLLWSQLNTAEDQKFMVISADESSAIVRNLDDNKLLKISYSKDEEGKICPDLENAQEQFVNNVDLEGKSVITDEEKNDVQNFFNIVKNAVSDAAEASESVAESLADVTDKFNAYVASYDDTKEHYAAALQSIETLTADKEKLQLDLNSLQQKFVECGEALKTQLTAAEQQNAEVATLREFKKNAELNEKKQILSKYTKLLSEEVIDEYGNKLEDYDALSLDKELAYALVLSSKEIFSKSAPVQEPTGYVVKEEPVDSLKELLDRQKHKNDWRK